MSWDDLIGLKPDVPFLELPSFEHEEEPLKNRTHEFLRRLFVPKERVLRVFNDGKNHWIQKQIIVYGKPGVGKTEFFKWLVWEAVKKYGEENVKAYGVEGNLKRLLGKKYEARPVILLCDDDATQEKLDERTIKKYVRIRHKCMKDTGLDSGLVITVVGLHRYHSSNPIVRCNFNFLVARNPPSGEYDFNFLVRYMGEESLKYLEKVDELRDKDETYIGHAVFANATSRILGPGRAVRGVITNNMIEEEKIKPFLEWVSEEEISIEDIKFEGDFSWKVAILPLIKAEWSEYAKFWEASELRGLDPRDEEFHKLTGVRKSQGYEMLKRMREDNAFQGWISETRGRLFEIYYKQKLESEGWKVKERVKFRYKGTVYVADLLAEKENEKKVINVKCGQGGSSYPFDKWKSEYYYSEMTGIPAELHFYDIETGEIKIKPLPKDKRTISF